VAEIEDLGLPRVVLVDQEEGRQLLGQERIDQRRIAAEDAESADGAHQEARQRRAREEIELG
jgi:hypothetical protein